MVTRKQLAAACAAVAVAVTSRYAEANGRFPAADYLVFDPDDSRHVSLGTTFGLLESWDGGVSWTWVCEAAVGYTGHPALGVMRGGSVLAAYFGRIGLSRESGCTWVSLPLASDHEYPFDVTLDAADPSLAWVVAGSVDGARRVSLLSVTASGSIDAVLEVGDGFVPTTVEVAASDPERIYVAGIVENLASVVLRSKDRGQTWERFEVPEHAASPLFLSAVDPNDPDRVYARVDGGGAFVAQPGTGGDQPSDHLLVSRDGGERWETVLSLQADMLGFALSPDGRVVAAGGPGQGLFLASTEDLVFRPGAPVSFLRCLRWSADGLFACGQEDMDGWTIARSLDQGQSFEPLWHQGDLQPLVCPAHSTTHAMCRSEWPDIARSIGARAELAMATEPATSASPVASPAQSGCNVSPRSGAAHAAVRTLSCASGLLMVGLWRRLRRRASNSEKRAADSCPGSCLLGARPGPPA